MKYEFLHKENTGRLIFIFAGWSTGPDFYRHINLPGWDVMLVYGYSDFHFPYSIFDEYPTVALFAWSLGVFMASKTIPFERLSLAVAVNGTETPVNDRSGIPIDIFKGTITTLNERNLKKFRMRMCGNQNFLHISESGLFPPLSDSSVSEQDSSNSEQDSSDSKQANSDPVSSERGESIALLKNQLEFVAAESTDASVDNSTLWHRVYVSTDDRIFPVSAQKTAWENHPSHPEIILLNEPHYVDLDNIIRTALPAKDKVALHFHKALSTYDDQAKAQRTIAERLTDFPGGTPLPPKKVLEIGPGSGIFTRLFAQRFQPQEIDFVDLYPLPHFGVAPNENYFAADAEEWISTRSSESYDAIISASAIQWFANPELFFKNAARLLRPGGLLLCSTFIPGNLFEMKAVNPFGLIYRRIEELEKMIGKFFMFAKLEEEEMIIRFESPRETLRHLKETGVGGGLATGRSPRELLAVTPLSLTYRPLYIYAVKTPDTTSDTLSSTQ